MQAAVVCLYAVLVCAHAVALSVELQLQWQWHSALAAVVHLQ
jgi:hypothetical protein